MICTLILSFINIYAYKVKHGLSKDRTSALMQTVTLWTLYLFVITQLLSLTESLRLVPLSVSWALPALSLLGLAFYQRKEVWNAFRPLFHLPAKRWLLIGTISVAAIYLAVQTVPYNWDSMTYHLSRIAHWAQNGSVAHYATNIIRQITSPVLAEFINLHVYILTGGSDLLFNLLQCLSYLGCGLLVWRIAGKLKCTPVFCYLACLLYMTMPIAFAEALTTQTDNISAFWLLAFVYILLDYLDPSRPITMDKSTIGNVCIMGLMVAFGYLTKPSVCFAMVILVLWLLAVCIIRRDHISTLLKLAGCALLCILLPLLPELLRNLHTFQAISDPIAGQRQIIGTLKPNYVLINFLKNFTYNMPTVLLKESPWLIIKIVVFAAGILGVELDHPSIAEDGTNYLLHTPPNYGHDTALNPLIVWLFAICIVWNILRIRKKNRDRCHPGSSYSIAAAISFLIFCAVLRWEPYVSRYMTAYFALLCPMIACQLEKLTQRPDQLSLRRSIIGILCFLCVMDAVNMGIDHRNICVRSGADERPYGYFVNRSNIFEAYASVSQDILAVGYQNIGIYMGENDYEYPFWVMLDSTINRLEHVNVSNASSIYADQEFQPDCIIWLSPIPADGVVCNGKAYSRIQQYGENQYLVTP